MQIDLVTLFKETMKDMEEWKKIENTDGKILVSSLGRIKSLLRIGISPTGMRKEYASVSEAERELDSRHISDVLKGKRKHVKGWTFSYKGVMS